MKQKFFKQIADLRFSIIILLLISLCSIIGTVIEQDQSIETYKINYPLINPIFGFLTWDKIIKFELNHVYQTWWFFLLIFLFGISLTSCTFLQQLPSLKIARRCQFFRTTNQFYKLKISTLLKNITFNKIFSRIKENQYSIFQQKNTIYCYKGLIGRIGPIIVHISMILVLLGTIFSSLFGFKAQEIVPKTDTFYVQNILNNGQLTTIPNISARINDFWITYTKTQTIRQFYSDISILDNNGNEVNRKTISVNYPLIFKDIYYYQTDWNLIGLRFECFDNKIIEYPLIKVLNKQNKIWLTLFSKNSEPADNFIILVDNLEGYSSIYNKTGQFLGNLEINENMNFNQLFTLSEIISSTGLQIKSDPGISIIYVGFLFLMLSTLISYISYSQIWIIQENKKIFIGGSTNRASFDFELEFLEFVK